jgi:hypothetical protein
MQQKTEDKTDRLCTALAYSATDNASWRKQMHAFKLRIARQHETVENRNARQISNTSSKNHLKPQRNDSSTMHLPWQLGVPKNHLMSQRNDSSTMHLPWQLGVLNNHLKPQRNNSSTMHLPWQLGVPKNHLKPQRNDSSTMHLPWQLGVLNNHLMSQRNDSSTMHLPWQLGVISSHLGKINKKLWAPPANCCAIAY